ncbi:MAG: Ribonuclease PH [Phycisphaerae bacterium]|nr:Ribonuclease PH [Phycisphaerae bacterium]
MSRADGRKAQELRPVKIVRHFNRNTPGSVLIATGETKVLCTAVLQAGVPKWREGSGLGWLTAEYDMLPGSTTTRRPRNRQQIDGRTQEIQRLIGRALRQAVDFARLGENTIQVDCDVLQADGGTRTASITGAYIAVVDAVQSALQKKMLARNCVITAVAAVSAGVVEGRALLDLDYREDVAAEVDMNLATTAEGGIIDIQATGEKSTCSRQQLERLIKLATAGVRQLLRIQAQVLRRRK